MTRDEFPEIVIGEFPEIEEDVRDNGGLLHMQMGDFAGVMQRAVIRGTGPR